MHSEKQRLESTKLSKPNKPNHKEIIDHFLLLVIPNHKTNHICFAIIDLEEIAIGYMDLMGRFPERSSQGN